MATDKRDYYEVLGISKDAGDDEIKKAYRKLAKANHPDLHPGDTAAEARFKEISEAYEVLSDADKRAKYDRFGHAGVDPSHGAGGAYGGFGGGFADFDLGDILGSFFGGGFGGDGGARRNAPRQGEHLRTNTVISFEEAAFGVTRTVDVERVERCEECSGSGAAKGTSPETCQTCRGTGQVRSTQRTPLGTFATTSPCQTCRGTGKVIKEPCGVCRGHGYIRKRRKIEIKIPAGIDDGQTISVRAQGSHGANGGPAGDLYVTVNIRPHPLFTRRGSDVYCDIPVSFVDAALGAEIEVATLDGRVKYTMPEGTQTGTVFRLKNRGIQNLHGKGRGDHYVRVIVEVPKNLTAKQKDMLREFGHALSPENHTEENRSFLGKIKDFFEQ